MPSRSASDSTTIEPEDPPTRELMLKDILERCGRAAAALDAQVARIEELRNLERQAPAILASLPAQLDAVAGAGYRLRPPPSRG